MFDPRIIADAAQLLIVAEVLHDQVAEANNKDFPGWMFAEDDDDPTG